MTRRLSAVAVLALLSAWMAQPASAARAVSTRGAKALDKTISAGGLFGIPQYTTAGLPACTALLAQAAPAAWDTTVPQLKVCDGTSWTAVAGSITSGTSPCTGCVADAVLFNDAGVVGSDAGLTYNKTTDILTLLKSGDTGALQVGRWGTTANRPGIRSTGDYTYLGAGTTGVVVVNNAGSAFLATVTSSSGAWSFGPSGSPTTARVLIEATSGVNRGLVVDSGTSTGNIFEFQDNGTPFFTGADGGITTKTAAMRGEDGTSTLPTYSFTNSTNTGLYWSAVNAALVFAKAGNDAAQIQNVGAIFTVNNTLGFATSPAAAADGFIRRFSAGVLQASGTTTNTTYLLGGGAAVASAAALPLPTGNVFHVTGTTTITSITSTNFASGTVITLIFDGILTFTDGSNLVLAGNFVTTASDTITLVYDGTNWHEVARSVN